MLQNPDWKYRYAALMAISAVGEGCHKQMEYMLPQFMDGVLNFLQDPVSSKFSERGCENLPIGFAKFREFFSTQEFVTQHAMLLVRCLQISLRISRKNSTIKSSPDCSWFSTITKIHELKLTQVQYTLLTNMFFIFYSSTFGTYWCVCS